VPAGRRRKADTTLVVALACGSSAESAAQKAGVSVRTVYRRLADPSFCAEVKDARADMVHRTSSMLSATGMNAVKTLATLQESAASEAVRLGAARATIELGFKMRKSLQEEQWLASVEERLEALLEQTERPD
jgi:hypothetical protein